MIKSLIIVPRGIVSFGSGPSKSSRNWRDLKGRDGRLSSLIRATREADTGIFVFHGPVVSFLTQGKGEGE